MRAAPIVASLLFACVAAPSALAQSGVSPSAAAPLGLGAGAPQSAGPPWLGVFINAGMHGVYIQEIIDDSPADRAGLEAGDEVLAVMNQRVHTPSQLIAEIGRHQVGDVVDLRFRRRGRRLERSVTLDAKPSEEDILHRRLVGKRAEALQAPVVSGDAGARLAELRGRVVVLLFAATECESCATLHRMLSRFVDRYADREAVAFVLSREPRARLARFAEQHRPSFTVLHDVGGAVASRYYITQEPTVIVIERDGRVSYVGIGGEDRLAIALEAAQRALTRGDL